MGARLWTALLLLGAVVFMHGLQCASADHPGGTPLLSPAAVAHDVDAPMAAVSAAMSDAGHTTAGSPAVGGVDAAGVVLHGQTDTSGHGGAGHLWSVCLAVLAAGLALLLGLAVRRLLRLGRAAALPAFTRAARSLTAFHPPELSALCVLRI
ncbi:hypothetical protein [Blastococcus haudaquaticus]|uniref:Uncharacterized protein n=1 Tax=Blastococcus haudaquaticus TaxID=1938745 RepID=A0A286H902_9ACTN|nr:hypothetical protein [Blastococcus haudaquaticus]SOE03724.1 hypothetical protein SAMN06272739_4313 [Blastococcus haudaquaticus]